MKQVDLTHYKTNQNKKSNKKPRKTTRKLNDSVVIDQKYSKKISTTYYYFGLFVNNE